MLPCRRSATHSARPVLAGLADTDPEEIATRRRNEINGTDVTAGRVQFGDHTAGVFGLVGKPERSCDVGQAGVVFLDDTQRGHGFMDEA